jgi:hypothetical protein
MVNDLKAGTLQPMNVEVEHFNISARSYNRDYICEEEAVMLIRMSK